jgi:hypothetical protein
MGGPRNGRWTRGVQKKVSAMKAELLTQLGHDPVGRERILMDLILQKYGTLLILNNRMKKRELVEETGEACSLVSKNVLAWMASMERSLAALFGDAAANEKFGGFIQ